MIWFWFISGDHDDALADPDTEAYLADQAELQWSVFGDPRCLVIRTIYFTFALVLAMCPISSFMMYFISVNFERCYFVVRVGSQLLHFSYFIQWFISSTSVMISSYFSVSALSLLFFLSYILRVASVVRSLQEGPSRLWSNVEYKRKPASVWSESYT